MLIATPGNANGASSPPVLFLQSFNEITRPRKTSILYVDLVYIQHRWYILNTQENRTKARVLGSLALPVEWGNWGVGCYSSTRPSRSRAGDLEAVEKGAR